MKFLIKDDFGCLVLFIVNYYSMANAIQVYSYMGSGGWCTQNTCMNSGHEDEEKEKKCQYSHSSLALYSINDAC